MTRGEARFSHVATLLVGVTGLVFGWMRYCAEPTDEFSLVNHPLEPSLQSWHIVLAPLLVLSLGMLWRTHVLAKLKSKRATRRKTGWLLALMGFPMIASGYLLQVAQEEFWRTTWIWVHGITSCLWILGYLLHQRSSRTAPAEKAEDGEPDWKLRPNDHLVEPMVQGLGFDEAEA